MHTLTASQLARFEAKIARTDGCWLWTASVDSDGYGQFAQSGKAHRIAYEIACGPIPPGRVIDHLCRVRRCVNPAHMEAVTNATNLRRGEKATKTECIRGHPFDTANTRIRANGTRQCRACMAWHQRQRRAAMTPEQYAAFRAQDREWGRRYYWARKRAHASTPR